MTFRIILSVISLLCLKGLLPCQDIQARAESMIAKARQLSDIRAKSAPAFRLSVEFSFANKGLATVEGTYTETWVSESQWSRETAVGELRLDEYSSTFACRGVGVYVDHAKRNARRPGRMCIYKACL
jgi:hypothetical protein